MAAKLKVGDEVVVIFGYDKGQYGRTLGINRERGRMAVEGVMMMRHHNKAERSQRGGLTGGIETREAVTHISNVMYYEPAATRTRLSNTTKRISSIRVGIRGEAVDHDGKEKTVRVRVSKTTEKDL